MAKDKGVRAKKESKRPGKNQKKRKLVRLDKTEQTAGISADEIVESGVSVTDAEDIDAPKKRAARKRSGNKNKNDFMRDAVPDDIPDADEVEDVYELDSSPARTAPKKDRAEKKAEKRALKAKAKAAKTRDKRKSAVQTGAEQTPGRRAHSLPRAGKKRKPLFAGISLVGLINRLAFWRKPKPRKNVDKAMNFADSGKRMGKQGRRKRRILIFVGAGVLAIAVVLTAVLVPLSQSRADTQEAAQTDAPQTDALQAEMAMAVPLDEETLHALEAEEAQNAAEAIPTTAPEEYAAFATPTAPPDVAGATTPEPAEDLGPIETTQPDPTLDPIDIEDLVEDFMVEADLYYNDAGYYSNYYEYTDEEIYMLAQVIHGEAKGESTTGRIAVGNVVMNRVFARGKFGSTIKSVITAPGQFSGWSASIRPSSSCKYAARKVLDDEVWVVPQNIQYFNSNKPAGVNWGSHKFWKRIGGHNFYSHNYSGRSRSNNIPPALFERTFKWPQYGCKPEKRVYRIQYMLERLGYDVTPDAYFGKDTVKAMKAFQKDKGLDVDGIAGPKTIETLIDEFGIEKFYIRFYT